MSHTEGSENPTAETGDTLAAPPALDVTQTTTAATQVIAVDEGVCCP